MSAAPSPSTIQRRRLEEDVRRGCALLLQLGVTDEELDRLLIKARLALARLFQEARERAELVAL
jgi:hypothetical protein